MRWLVRLLIVGLVGGWLLGAIAVGQGSEAAPAGDEGATGLPAPGEPWDLVYMTDSTGWGVARPYAERAQEVLGVEVRPHDLTAGGLSAVHILELLERRFYAHQVANAEIIVVFGNARDSGISLPTPDIETCISTSTARRPPLAPSSAVEWAPYREALGRVFDRIWDLRDGRPTVFLAVDVHSPVLGQWGEAGILPDCTRGWEMMSDQIRAAAEAHGVRMMSVFDALNGPQHDRDLVELGWVRPDGEHLFPDGAAAIAPSSSATPRTSCRTRSAPTRPRSGLGPRSTSTSRTTALPGRLR